MNKRLYSDEERKARRAVASKTYYDRTKEATALKRAPQRAAYRTHNKDQIAAYQKEYYDQNSVALNVNKKMKRTDPMYVAQERATYARWFQDNRHIDSAKQHRRRACQLQAVPQWFSELDAFILEEASTLCRLREQATGVQWQIDHVVPLVSETVCGLHIGGNIAVITAKANQAKGNRHWPDMA